MHDEIERGDIESEDPEVRKKVTNLVEKIITAKLAKVNEDSKIQYEYHSNETDVDIDPTDSIIEEMKVRT